VAGEIPTATRRTLDGRLQLALAISLIIAIPGGMVTPAPGPASIGGADAGASEAEADVGFAGE